ncbi:MAG: OB-fold nucleic acid binding domain-containing protein [Candidatus Bathyarchaeota archaeon]|nr:OB-fold nucleic acid binding domain-containing protein [Candidatus Bathyarchaeota archaeon]
MSTEDIIKRILALKPNLTEEAVRELIEQERAKAAGLLTEEAAAHLVSSNLGINGAGERIEAKLKIADLTAGLSDVSLTGRVIHIFPSRSFDRDNNRKGKVLRLIIGDKTGSVVVVFWDDKADHVEASKLKPGKIVRILHGYSRERRGNIEINIGNRGQLFMEPMDAVEEDYPKLENFFLTPADVHAEGAVNLEGVVMDSFPPSTFQRQDGSEGKVGRLVLEEGGARINLVLWDDNVDEYGDLPKGTKIQVIAGNVRTSNQGNPEVHVGWDTAIKIVEKGVKPDEPVPYWTKIGSLSESMGSVNVAAIASQIGDEREFVRRDGTEGKVVSVLLEDDTGTVRLSLWDDDADKATEIENGAMIVVENGYTRSGFGGGVELNVGRNGRVHIDPEDFEMEIPEIERKITEIIDLREGQHNVTIRGQLLDDPVQRDIDTSRGPASVTNFRIDDGTGEARVSLWREHAEAAMDLTAGAEVQLEYMNVREPYDGIIQVSSGAFTKIVVTKE